MASVSRLRLTKPEILCGKGQIHTFGGRTPQQKVWRFVVFLSQLEMKFHQKSVAQSRLEETLIGRGFHLPFIIVLFTIIALEILDASPVPRMDFSYGPAELFLRTLFTLFQD